MRRPCSRRDGAIERPSASGCREYSYGGFGGRHPHFNPHAVFGKPSQGFSRAVVACAGRWRRWPRPCHHQPSPHCRPGGACVPSSRHRRASECERLGCGRGRFMIVSGLWPGALGGTRTPSLQIRRCPYWRPGLFRPVRDLGLASSRCPGEFGASQGCSSAWLSEWLPNPTT
jgi:hypothetical protein